MDRLSRKREQFMKISPARSRALAILALALSTLPFRLAADDFAFHEPGARAAGLGGAFTARSDDPIGLFYNPAGLAFQTGFRIKTDIGFGKRETTATWPDSGTRYHTDPSEFTGNIALSWQPIKRVTIATGFFSPYNYDAYWSPGWPGETVCARNRVRSLYFRSAVAVEVFKGFAVSGGVDVVSSDLWWRHYIPFNIPNYPLDRDIDIESSHTGHGSGLGFTAGALWKIVPAVQIGVRYQQDVAIDYSGSNMFIQPMDTTGQTVPRPGGGTIRVSDLIDLYYADQDVTAQLKFPRTLAGGIAVSPAAALSLYVDIQWDRWEGFGDWIFTSVNEGDALNPAFPPSYQEFYGLPLDYGVQGVPLTLMDTKDIKTGVEYRPAQHIAIRAGYARRASSVDEAGRTPIYPDLDRNLYSIGFGYEGPLFSIYSEDEKVSDLSFDVFLRYASASSGASTFPGLELTYDSGRLTFGIGAGFVF
jgi:long-chain fatty acid transport protein